MFCQNCGNQVSDNASFCPACEQSLNSKSSQDNTKTQMYWVLIFVAIGLGLLSLLLFLNLENPFKAKDVILPSIFALGAVGFSGYVFMTTKGKTEDKAATIFSLIILIGAIILSVELCLGKLIETWIS